MHLIAATAMSVGLLFTSAHSAPVDWQARTCAAAAAYGSHQTASGLSAVISDALRLKGKSYLKADALDLAATAFSPSANAPKYIPKDIRYIKEDCAK